MENEMQETGSKTTPDSDDLVEGLQKGKAAAKRKADKLASGLKSTIKDAAADVREEAAKTVREGASEAAELGKNQTRHIVRSLGRALAAGGRSLDDDGMNGTAGYVRAAGRGLENAADEIGGLDPSHVGRKIENFVRERPMVTVGALAFVGFALASTFSSRNQDRT